MKRLALACVLVLITGCTSTMVQDRMNPISEFTYWQAEQKHMLAKLEEFCFDRSWNSPPYKMTEELRPLPGGRLREYKLVGNINHMEPGESSNPLTNRDHHHTCWVGTWINVHKTPTPGGAVSAPRRASPWWSHQRRTAFHALLEIRFDPLVSSPAPSHRGHHKAPVGHVMLLRDGQTQINVHYREDQSGVQINVYRRQVLRGDAASLDSFPRGAKVLHPLDVMQLAEGRVRGQSFIQLDMPATPLMLDDVLAFRHLSADQVLDIEARRAALSDEDRLLLQVQAERNLQRYESELRWRNETHNDAIEWARRDAEFARRQAAARAAANQAILTNVMTAVYADSVAAAGGSSSGSSAGSYSSQSSGGTFSSGLNTALLPWADIQAEADRARQMKQAQFDASQQQQQQARQALAQTQTQSRVQAQARTQGQAQGQASSSSSGNGRGTGAEALAYCWKNESGAGWLCDGRIQNTLIANPDLNDALRLSGCPAPRHEEALHGDSRLFCCGFRLDDSDTARHTTNRDIRQWQPVTEPNCGIPLPVPSLP